VVANSVGRVATRIGLAEWFKAMRIPLTDILTWIRKPWRDVMLRLDQRRSILRSNTHRMRAFLGYRSVVNHQHGIIAADEPICLDKQFYFHCAIRPALSRNVPGGVCEVTKQRPHNDREFRGARPE
jgi:hypothetical protein